MKSQPTTNLRFRMTTGRDMTRLPNVQLAKLEHKAVDKCLRRLEERARSLESSKISTKTSCLAKTEQNSLCENNQTNASTDNPSNPIYSLFNKSRNARLRNTNNSTFNRSIEIAIKDVSIDHFNDNQKLKLIDDCQRVFFDNIDRVHKLKFTESITGFNVNDHSGYNTQQYQFRKKPTTDILRYLAKNRKVDGDTVKKVGVMLTNRNCRDG